MQRFGAASEPGQRQTSPVTACSVEYCCQWPQDRKDLLQELRDLPRNVCVRRVNEIVARARAVKVHLALCYLASDVSTQHGSKALLFVPRGMRRFALICFAMLCYALLVCLADDGAGAWVVASVTLLSIPSPEAVPCVLVFLPLASVAGDGAIKCGFQSICPRCPASCYFGHAALSAVSG